MCACMLRAGPVRMQKKERSEMTGHEGGENMKRKRRGSVREGERNLCVRLRPGQAPLGLEELRPLRPTLSLLLSADD